MPLIALGKSLSGPISASLLSKSEHELSATASRALRGEFGNSIVPAGRPKTCVCTGGGFTIFTLRLKGIKHMCDRGAKVFEHVGVRMPLVIRVTAYLRAGLNSASSHDQGKAGLVLSPPLFWCFFFSSK